MDSTRPPEVHSGPVSVALRVETPMPNSLSATEVAKLDKPGVHRVDRRLYLQILPATEQGKPFGSRSWLFRYMLNRRPRQMGLGPYPDIPLAKALNRAVAAQRQLLDGVDPIDVRRAEKKAAMAAEATVPTFAACAEAYIAAKADGWSNEKHAYQWSQSIQTYANPTIGKLPVSEVTADLVEKVLRPIWSTKSETAGRLRGRIEAILDWARVQGYRSGPNPAKWKGELLAPAPRTLGCAEDRASRGVALRRRAGLPRGPRRA